MATCEHQLDSRRGRAHASDMKVGGCPNCGDIPTKIIVEELPIAGREGEFVHTFVCPDCNQIISVAFGSGTGRTTPDAAKEST